MTIAASHLTPPLSDGVIALRPFGLADAATLLEADRDPEHRRRFETPANHVPSLPHCEAVISHWQLEWAREDRFAFAVRELARDDAVGGCELRPLGGGSAALSYWTLARERGRGLATRAALLACRFARDRLGLARIEAETDPDNFASQCVLARAGFTRRGGRDGCLWFELVVAR